MKRLLAFIYRMDTSGKQFDASLLIFRILISASLLNTHGLKKIQDFEGTVAHIPDPLNMGGELSTYFAVFANVICPIFISLGFSTRLFILPILSITLMGFFIVHANDPWPVRDVPLMYSLSFLLLFVLGPGEYSIDSSIAKALKK